MSTLHQVYISKLYVLQPAQTRAALMIMISLVLMTFAAIVDFRHERLRCGLHSSISSLPFGFNATVVATTETISLSTDSIASRSWWYDSLWLWVVSLTLFIEACLIVIDIEIKYIAHHKCFHCPTALALRASGWTEAAPVPDIVYSPLLGRIERRPLSLLDLACFDAAQGSSQQRGVFA